MQYICNHYSSTPSTAALTGVGETTFCQILSFCKPTLLFANITLVSNYLLIFAQCHLHPPNSLRSLPHPRPKNRDPIPNLMLWSQPHPNPGLLLHHHLSHPAHPNPGDVARDWVLRPNPGFLDFNRGSKPPRRTQWHSLWSSRRRAV